MTGSGPRKPRGLAPVWERLDDWLATAGLSARHARIYRVGHFRHCVLVLGGVEVVHTKAVRQEDAISRALFIASQQR